MSLSMRLGVAAMALLTLSAFGTEVRLNNLVVELGAWRDAAGPVSFVNPRPGWVFVSVKASRNEGSMSLVAVDGGATWPLPLGPAPTECMRWLEAGAHEIRPADSETMLLEATARAVPEMHFCRYPVVPIVPAFGGTDWASLEAHVLPHVNAIVGNPTAEMDAHVASWLARGGKWIGYYGLPHQEGLTAQQAFEHWAAHAGFQDPRLSGLIADEFSGRQNSWYPAWIEGIRLLGAWEKRGERAFYGYCGGPAMYTRPQARALVRAVFDQGFYMAYERYHHEEPTLEEMRALMDRLLGAELPKWRETFPGCQRRMLLVLGLFAQGMGLNVRPDVDFKVHMDLQMQYLATHPAFQDLFGIHWWVADYADDELIPWMGRLYRHYGIEGQRELLSDRYGYAYELAHIQNPDFSEGFAGWRAMPAAIDSMGVGYMERYARLQGRYWHRAGFPDEPAGNTYLWMDQHPEKPNVVMQRMDGLVPGALYSVKMITADFNDIDQGVSEEKLHAVALTVTAAETIADKSFQAAYPSRTWEPFLDKPAWFDLHRLVFRAEKEHAWLCIADRPSGVPSAATAASRLMVNFIEVQPYFDPAE